MGREDPHASPHRPPIAPDAHDGRFHAPGVRGVRSARARRRTAIFRRFDLPDRRLRSHSLRGFGSRHRLPLCRACRDARPATTGEVLLAAHGGAAADCERRPILVSGRVGDPPTGHVAVVLLAPRTCHVLVRVRYDSPLPGRRCARSHHPFFGVCGRLHAGAGRIAAIDDRPHGRLPFSASAPAAVWVAGCCALLPTGARSAPRPGCGPRQSGDSGAPRPDPLRIHSFLTPRSCGPRFLSSAATGPRMGSRPLVSSTGATAMADSAALLTTHGARFAHVVNTTVFLTDMADFAGCTPRSPPIFGDTRPARVPWPSPVCRGWRASNRGVGPSPALTGLWSRSHAAPGALLSRWQRTSEDRHPRNAPVPLHSAGRAAVLCHS